MNRIKEIIKSKETFAFQFRPSKRFYEHIQINRKRFGMLLRNEKEPTIGEIQRLADYFGVDLMELIKDENNDKTNKSYGKQP